MVANDVPNAPEVPQINAAALKMFNKFIGRGLNDSMLQENITKMQEISTAYNQLGLPVQEQARNLSSVEKLSRARANQQDVGGNAPIMV